jgi:adenine-specific DNA-methyltransferase
MTKKQQLELTWIGKDVCPRILLEDRERSYHAAHWVTDHDRFGNRNST